MFLLQRRSVTTTGLRTPAPAMVKMPYQVVAIEAMFSAPVGIVDKPGRATCVSAKTARAASCLKIMTLCPSENGEQGSR